MGTRGYVAVTGGVSVASADNSLNSTALFGSILADDWVTLSGFAETANAGLAQVATATSSKLVLTGITLTTEATAATGKVEVARLHDKVRAAFTAAVVALPGMPTVIIPENADVDAPTQGTPHLRVYILPNRSERTTTSVPGRYEALGILQVSVYTPLGEGAGRSDRLAGAIADRFDSGTAVTAGGITVLCWRSWRESGRVDRSWWVVPVKAEWWLETTEL
jgi:hypothetical protein